NGAMSAQNKQGEIRKNIIQDDLLYAVIALPKELFYTTSIPACLFIISKGKSTDQYRDRSGETLFIDARDLYESVSKSQNRLTEDQIDKIASTVRAYRGEDSVEVYEDEKGFCKKISTQEIAENRHIASPGRYVELEKKEGDNRSFEKKMEILSTDLRENLQKSKELQKKIEENLEVLGF
ncbi:MAG: N-6 DNA methylase, partial [Candidatus Paceibacteria bacterium]